MTNEEIKESVDKLQQQALKVKLEIGNMRNEINNLQNAIRGTQTLEAEYQRGYEDGFREGRTRKELVEAKDEEDLSAE